MATVAAQKQAHWFKSNLVVFLLTAGFNPEFL
jgi:hypothetical protein